MPIWQHSSRNARREASRTTGCGRAPSACSRSCADTLRSMPPSGLASASFGPELAARADIILDAGLRAERVDQIGRAHVCTPVHNAHLVCPLLLEKQKNKN